MMRARRKLVEEGKEKKVAFQRGQIDCLRAHPNLRSRDGFYNRRTGDFDLPEAGPGRAALCVASLSGVGGESGRQPGPGVAPYRAEGNPSNFHVCRPPLRW